MNLPITIERAQKLYPLAQRLIPTNDKQLVLPIAGGKREIIRPKRTIDGVRVGIGVKSFVVAVFL
jgi:hypothetical protein